VTLVFPVSGIEAPFWLPPLVALVISFFTSMAGVSGACLLLPFQMSMLGFVSPAVSPTNLVFNVVAIPSGAYRYWREGRMVWPLAWVVILGTVPGVIAGGFLRLIYLPQPRPFKAFVGCVLLYIGARMFLDMTRERRPPSNEQGWSAQPLPSNWRRLRFEFQGRKYECGTAGIFLLSLVVGVIGGAYGIGGGAIIAPFFVAIYGLPMHTIAGATLMGTFVTSVFGVSFYQLVSPYFRASGMAVAPDWPLGLLFGLGGMAGTYLGARTQRFVPVLWLKVMLTLILLSVALSYLVGFFRS
jgi:uncharacterized membrane protein YfcA